MGEAEDEEEEDDENILEDEIPKEAEDILEDEIPKNEDEPENNEVKIEKDDAAKEDDSLMKSMETDKLDDEEADTAEESVQKFYREKGLLDVPEKEADSKETEDK